MIALFSNLLTMSSSSNESKDQLSVHSQEDQNIMVLGHKGANIEAIRNSTNALVSIYGDQDDKQRKVLIFLSMDWFGMRIPVRIPGNQEILSPCKLTLELLSPVHTPHILIT